MDAESYRIKSILFIYFHHTEGMRIQHQYPPGVIDEKEITQMSCLLMPHTDIANQILGFRINNFKLIGYPVCLMGEKYPRKYFLVNFVFVFDANAQTTDYGPIISSIGHFLYSAECQSGCLFKDSEVVDLGDTVKEVYHGLNKMGECPLKISPEWTLRLKLTHKEFFGDAFCNTDIPKRVSPQAFDCRHWSLSSIFVYSQIDGYKNIEDIANESNIFPEDVWEMISQFVISKCACLIKFVGPDEIYGTTTRTVDFYASLKQNGGRDFPRLMEFAKEGVNDGDLMRAVCLFSRRATVASLKYGFILGESNFDDFVRAAVEEGVLKKEKLPFNYFANFINKC